MMNISPIVNSVKCTVLTRFARLSDCQIASICFLPCRHAMPLRTYDILKSIISLSNIRMSCAVCCMLYPMVCTWYVRLGGKYNGPLQRNRQGSKAIAQYSRQQVNTTVIYDRSLNRVVLWYTLTLTLTRSLEDSPSLHQMKKKRGQKGHFISIHLEGTSFTTVSVY